MYCPKCGKQLTEDAVFCNNCGYKVSQDSPSTEKEIPTEEPVWEEREAPEVPAGRNGKKPPKKKGKGIVVGILALLILTGVITAIAGLLTIKTKMKKADTATAQEQLETKNEETEEEKKDAEETKVIGEKPEARDKETKGTEKEVEKDTAELEKTEKKEDGPILIGGERPKQPAKKETSKKKPKKTSRQPAKKPEAQAADPGFQVQSQSEQVYDSGNAQPPVQQDVSSEYILPISNQVYLTYADVDHLSLKEVNYAKNEIFARHGRKFASPELQNYFNSKSWYVGTIEPGAFTNDMLSSMEVENANFLATVEHNIDPNGYPLDQ